MQYTIKELQTQWLSKNLIYEALKTVLPFSKQFLKNKRIFDKKDIEMFEKCKQFGIEKTVLKYSWKEKIGKNKIISNNSQTVFKNSFETDTTNNDKALENKLKTVTKQFENREEELQQTIKQKEEIIQVKNEQTQKYALLKQEEKKEKEEWIKKYDEVQKEKNEWVGKFYSVKMYMMIFLILFVLMVAFEVVQYLK